MTNIGGCGYALPVASPALKQASHLDVKVGWHAGMIAKFCAERKQPFAPESSNALRMPKTSINETVAEALAWHMQQAGLTAKSLGEAAGLSPRTVGNFLNPAGRVQGDRGKEPSGKLTELALIADALGVAVSDLVSPMTVEQREEQRRLRLAAHVLMTGRVPTEDNAEGSAPTTKRRQLAA